jgi:nucleotide-binding universal stress UspA family protein
VPVLLANPLALPERQELRIKKILVPVDGSDLSAEALPLAEDVAELFGSEIVLIRAIELVAVTDPIIMVSPTADREATQARLDELAKRVTSVPVTTRVVLGTPSVEILDAARECDLVALTTHGRSGVSRWAFGSVAEQVLRHCSCPVLVKRTAGFESQEGRKTASASSARQKSA